MGYAEAEIEEELVSCVKVFVCVVDVSYTLKTDLLLKSRGRHVDGSRRLKVPIDGLIAAKSFFFDSSRSRQVKYKGGYTVSHGVYIFLALLRPRVLKLKVGCGEVAVAVAVAVGSYSTSGEVGRAADSMRCGAI